MTFAVTIDDRTYSIQLPWWLLAALLAVGVVWQPATAWASDQFSDVPDANVFHDDIEWMANVGVTRGCGGDRFCPSEFVTREQMAAFMNRFADQVVEPAAAGTSPEVTSRLAALESDVDTLASDVDTLQSQVASLQSKNASLESANAALESLLAGVTRSGNLLTFGGMNVRIVDGSGDTAGAVNGLGNLIVGYNENSSGFSRTGSHNLVVGRHHGYSSWGGLVAGEFNRLTGTGASISGGQANVASGSYASVSGGDQNTASGFASSVSGGALNTASGLYSSVSGGNSNTASGSYSSVSGGASGSVTNTSDWRAGTLFEDD